MTELLCPWEPAQFLIYSSNVPALLYYSHIPAIVAALLVILLINRRSQRNPVTTALTTLFSLFTFWVFADLILWATNRPDITMFFWSMQILVEVLIYTVAFYASYIFISGKEPTFSRKLYFFAPVALFILLIPTNLNLTGVELETCYAQESNIVIYFSYALETACAIGIVLVAFTHFKLALLEKRKQIVYYTIGILIFLLALTYGNVIGSFSDNWVLAQYGLFGMPVFIGFLAFLIVRFKIFDIKLVGAQALIVSLIVLIGSQFFFIQNNTNRILTAITLAITGAIGINLIRSVKKEVEQREKIEKQEQELEKANARLKELDQLKSEFVSLATHQIRGPLTAIKGYASMMRDGDYGELPENLKPTVNTIFESSNALAGVVQDFLDVSRIEQGRMKYEITVFDIGKLVYAVAEELGPNTEKKGLRIKLDIEPNLIVEADTGKLRQVFENLIDNALKYTASGFIFVTVKRTDAGMVRIAIRDTGVGIRPETVPKLFQKFSRAEDASKANIRGTGLGLYVAKNLVEAQKGKVWAESEGEGKGSTFIVELPLKS